MTLSGVPEFDGYDTLELSLIGLAAEEADSFSTATSLKESCNHDID
jgi:hypothetical protein